MNKTENKKINRNNVSHACEYCRKRKVKCSGEKPKCKNCFELNLACVYNLKNKKRGPKSGYIDKLVQKTLQQQLEKLIDENIITGKDIYKLSSFHSDIINSSSILSNHLNDFIRKKDSNKNLEENIKGKKENFTRKEKINNITDNKKDFDQTILSKLSNLKENEYLIFDILEKTKKIGNALLVNKTHHLNYYVIEIDNTLIDFYFRFVYINLPVISRETVMEHIQNKTILPELLLAMYSAAYMFKPNPDIEKSRKYNKIALFFLTNYEHDLDVQMIQAYTIIIRCIAGTNLCWILFGYIIRSSHILNLVKENKHLNKRRNIENKLTFWYIVSMDMILSIITGRSYRYDYSDLLNSDNIVNLIKKIDFNKPSKIVIMDLVLSRLLDIVVQYIRECHSNSPNILYLEKKIEYWFKLYNESIFLSDELNYNTTFSHYIIFFCTLKLIYYRHKSTSIISNHSISTSDEDKYIVIKSLKNKYLDDKYFDTFLEYSYNFLTNKNLKNVDTQESEYNNDTYINENSHFSDCQKENNSFIRFNKGNADNYDMFITDNHVYIKVKNVVPLKINYMNNGNTFFNNDIILNEDVIQNLDVNCLNDGKNNIKRSYENSFSNAEQETYKKSNFKRFKAWTNLSEVNTNPPIFEDKLMKKVYDNLQNLSSNSNKTDLIDDNIDDDQYQNLYYPIINKQNSINNLYEGQSSNVDENNSKIDKKDDQLNEININIDDQDAIFENILNPFNETNNNDTHNHLNLINNKLIEDDSLNYLKKCYLIANDITQKIKVLKLNLDKNNLIYNYILSWCFYEIGIIFIILYVKEGKEEHYQMAKYYEEILNEGSRFFIAINPYLSKFREMMEKAKISVQNNSKMLVIKDIF